MAAAAPVVPQLLVVEANPTIELILQRELAEMGYVSTSASSLEQGLCLLNQRPFDLIVTDTFSHSGQEPLADRKSVV